MAGIYQEIWNADQAQNGVEAILDTHNGTQQQGFVKVNSSLDESSNPDLKVLSEVHIPPNKMQTYELCRKLFNNYTLEERMRENDTPEEEREIHDFVTAIRDTQPMQVARDYIERQTGSPITPEHWHNTLVELWFKRFSSGGDPELSGFEHIVVGEQESLKVQGYHFWWKYFLDDGFGSLVDDGAANNIPGLSNDRIFYNGSKQKSGQLKFPESVTISYRWNAPDYENNRIRNLSKNIGGFFVGCSVEGLMALGTVLAHRGVRAPKTAVIEGARYDMKLFHSGNGKHIRTFFPIFLGAADITDGGGREEGGGNNVPPIIDGGVDGSETPPEDTPRNSTAALRIIAAIVNPPGHDPGAETVTLVNAGAVDIDLSGWSIEDKHKRALNIEGKIIQAGEFYTIILSGKDLQLANKGGAIVLLDPEKNIMHRVGYSKVQAKNQGATILF